MVIFWNQCGRPEGTRPHRFRPWARVVGGILLANNQPEFLANAQATAAEFNSVMDELAALAEAVVGNEGPYRVMAQNDNQESHHGT